MRLKLCQKVIKNKRIKILEIVDNICHFTLKEQKTGSGLETLTPNQMLSRLTTGLAQK